MDLSQHTKALASGSEFVCEASESVMDRNRSLSDRPVHYSVDVTHLALFFFPGILYSHLPNKSQVI